MSFSTLEKLNSLARKVEACRMRRHDLTKTEESVAHLRRNGTSCLSFTFTPVVPLSVAKEVDDIFTEVLKDYTYRALREIELRIAVEKHAVTSDEEFNCKQLQLCLRGAGSVMGENND